MAYDLALFVNGHQAAECKPVLPRVQRTDAVGKLVRQHRNHPVHQVDAGSSLPCLPVKRRILLHIIRHVRNMHAKQILLPLFCQADRIVQILRVLAVDCHHLHIAQVTPSCRIRLGNLIRDILHLTHNLFRKFNRKLIPFYNGHDIHARIIDMPQNLCNLSFRFPVVFAIIRYLADNLMTGHRSL